MRSLQEFMRQRLDLDWLYRRARHRFPQQFDSKPPLPLPEMCRVTLDELLTGPG